MSSFVGRSFILSYQSELSWASRHYGLFITKRKDQLLSCKAFPLLSRRILCYQSKIRQVCRYTGSLERPPLSVGFFTNSHTLSTQKTY
ncbi:hypothetical protein O181_024088 [Austropuccinia psidii MF-1]|uniref:Uncharacterized protein n=1 Tax=Austropuccinia psidii MF-1 TaxID=1389203 RepID=A0A9Q3GXW4_9BASI|nr:hypothetical protein [Austropuccinia psidii MF-1]